MSIIKRLLNNIESLPMDDDIHNAIVHIPKHTVSVSVFKKKQKYVKSCEGKKKCENKGIIDKYLSPFRPETPVGMERVIEKKPVGKWSFTLYRKQRIYVSN